MFSCFFIIGKYLPELYSKLRKQLQNHVVKAPHLAMTTDVWTDDFKHNAYMNLTCHFINDDWLLESFLSETLLLTGSVTGVKIDEKLTAVIKDWCLQSITKTLVSDQGANIQCAGRIGKWHHTDCVDHRLNLCLTT